MKASRPDKHLLIVDFIKFVQERKAVCKLAHLRVLFFQLKIRPKMQQQDYSALQ